VTNARHAVVTGIGVNCRHHPQDTAYAATDLHAAGCAVAPKDMFAALADCFMRRLAQWQGGTGFSAIRNAWLARAHGIDSEIEVRLPERSLRGTFRAIDENGALVLGLEGGHSELIRAGDVFPAAG
jgi:BirA family biotin operon repressor/biotin-[acetyl-CoA-carboxylase] ligase